MWSQLTGSYCAGHYAPGNLSLISDFRQLLYYICCSIFIQPDRLVLGSHSCCIVYHIIRIPIVRMLAWSQCWSNWSVYPRRISENVPLPGYLSSIFPEWSENISVSDSKLPEIILILTFSSIVCDTTNPYTSWSCQTTMKSCFWFITLCSTLDGSCCLVCSDAS